MKERIALLLGFIRKQRTVVDRFIEDVRKRNTPPSTKEECVYIGYVFHNLYCALEDMFQEIAKTFENQVEDTSRFHRLLLRRMTIDVPDIRPWILSDESYVTIDELRGFRHIFRHGYDYELSPEKLMNLSVRLLSKWESVENDLKNFEKFLEQCLGASGMKTK